MTALRHISIGLVALLVVVLGGAWLVPPWLDWDRYRQDVAGLASDVLGQQVRIDGAITLRLLPQPLLVAGKVSVLTGGGAAMTAERLVLRVGLAPLLAGRIDARELVLRGADIRLPWPLDPSALALRAPSWLSSLSARIERGRLQLGEVEVTALDATLATSNISGSFLSAGRAHGGGRDWMYTARISQPGGDGAVGIEVTLDGQGMAQGVGAVLSGQMQADGTLLGRIAVRGPDLSQLLPAPAVPFRAEGRLTSGGGLVAADELVGELAGSPVQGAVALRLAPAVRLDVALTASRLDLDAWMPALLRGAGDGALARFPVGIDLSAEAAPLAGGTLRRLRGAFDLGGGRMQVREARAMLPGDAALRLSGAVVASGAAKGALRFDGTAQLEAPALRTTLAWAAQGGLGKVDALPPGVLRRATLSGKLALAAGTLTLVELGGQVDGATIAASLTWRPGPRPMLRGALRVDQLALDPWLPEARPGLMAAAGAFGALTLDLKLDAARAVWRGASIAGLALELAAEPGRVAIRRLEMQALGASIAASGALLDGGRLAETRAELRAERASPLAPIVAGALGPAIAERLAPLLRDAAHVQLQAAGPPAALALKLSAELGDLRLEAAPTLDLPAGRWAGALTLRHPGAPRLAEALGLTGATAWLGDGSLALVARLAGGPPFLAAETFDLAAGGLRADGTLRLDLGAVPRLTGRVRADSLPLPLPYPRSPDPLPLDWLAGWTATLALAAQHVVVAQEPLLEDASATLTLADGRVELASLAARLGGGRLAATLSFDTAAQPPALAAQATLAGAMVTGPVFDTPLDITAGTLDATLGITAAGFSPAGLLASLAGQVSLAGRDGVLAGIDVARMGPRLDEADLRAALAGGSSAFSHLAMAAVVDRGAVTLGRATLAGPAGRVTASGTIDLTRAQLDLRLAVVPDVTDAPEIGLLLRGPAGAAERVPELAGAVRWRAEHP
ncbi:MAG: AsmA family protein [Acetobacteraceae bacterium]|nr:AsmA family protein [Acetobacteraceae bacterium]